MNDIYDLESMINVLGKTDDFQIMADLFKHLGDSTRLKLFWLLCHHEECVVNIAALLNMSSPAVSHHLKILKDSGLITFRRDGQEVYYKASGSICSDLLHTVIEQAMEIACPDSQGRTDFTCPDSPDHETGSCPDTPHVYDHEPDGSRTYRHYCDECFPHYHDQDTVNPADYHDRELMDFMCDTGSETMNPECNSDQNVTLPDKDIGRNTMGSRHNADCISMIPANGHHLTKYREEQLITIRRIHEELSRNLDKRISLEEMSRKYLMNPTTIKVLFKELYGTSIAAHIRDHRMEKAADLLRNTSDNISDIAAEVGYNSQSKFTAAFREYYGMLPKDYRKQP